MSVSAPRRRANGDEYRVRTPHCRSQIRRESQSPCAYIIGNKVIQTRLEYRDFSAIQAGDLDLVLVLNDVKACGHALPLDVHLRIVNSTWQNS